MARRPLRIVHTVSSLRGGGMEHFVLRLADAQRAKGHTVAIVALQDGPLLEQAREMALDVRVLRGKGKVGRLADNLWTMASYRPDVVHAHNPTSMHYAAIGKVVGRARLVVTDHAQTRGIIRVPSKLEWRLTDAVVAVSKDTAEKSGAVGLVDDIRVFHNGIDVKKARRTRDEVRTELGLTTEIVGLNVAGFFKVKAHDVLVRAMAEVPASDPRIRVLAVGDGAEKPAVESLAAELGVGQDKVRFLGFRSDVPDLLEAADFFVLPSRMEGLPLSILEAMAHRLPIVATPVGGNPELVTDGIEGFLVPVDDPKALAAAMVKLAKDPDLRREMGEKGYRRVTEDFSFDRMNTKYENLYYQLLN